jgi:endothelin-converting enzyme/putative endopeptidase
VEICHGQYLNDSCEQNNTASSWGSFDELRQKTDADALAILKEATNPKYKSDTDQGNQFVQNDT